MKPLIIAEEAEHELAGSVAFYEKKQSGLGLDFERAAQEVLKKIVSAPERWPAGKYGTRHYLMQRFPFVIHYLDNRTEFGSSPLRTPAENQIIGKRGFRGRARVSARKQSCKRKTPTGRWLQTRVPFRAVVR